MAIFSLSSSYYALPSQHWFLPWELEMGGKREVSFKKEL